MVHNLRKLGKPHRIRRRLKMAESMQGLHRTCRCAEVTTQMVSSEVTLMGWVQKARDKGGIIFVDLRDRSGIMQLIFENGSIDEEGLCQSRQAEK